MGGFIAGLIDYGIRNAMVVPAATTTTTTTTTMPPRRKFKNKDKKNKDKKKHKKNRKNNHPEATVVEKEIEDNMNEVVEKLDQEPVAEPVVVDAADETGDASE